MARRSPGGAETHSLRRRNTPRVAHGEGSPHRRQTLTHCALSARMQRPQVVRTKDVMACHRKKHENDHTSAVPGAGPCFDT